jgi:hypothetical protein
VELEAPFYVFVVQLFTVKGGQKGGQNLVVNGGVWGVVVLLLLVFVLV